MSKYKLPENYIERKEMSYFDDSANFESDIVHQPEVYEAAEYFLQSGRRTTIIDVGCGSGRKLRSVNADRHIGVDFGSNLSFCRQRFDAWGEWIEADLSREDCIVLADHADGGTVVVCADVIEHLLDPEPLVALLCACYRRGALVLTSTPDRIRARGAEHCGPAPNRSHIREWALEEYVEFLADHDLPVAYAGYTLNNSVMRELRTIVTIHDIAVDRARVNATRDRPLAILACYNEADVIAEVAADIVEQGCDLVAIDNWSTDETWSILTTLAASNPLRIGLERFPAGGPDVHFEWRQILRRKEVVAHKFPGRWIVHTDADELRRSPFLDLTLADALHVAQQTGANRVDFNVINFRPVDDRPFRPGTLETDLSYFEYGTRPGHFKQAKAWLQGADAVDLASSGGHSAEFSGAVSFPYKFLLRHYPIRSAEHGRRKVLMERRGRWSPDERAAGWHVQYDEFSEMSSFKWEQEKLIGCDASFWREHGLPIMTDIAERRWKSRPRVDGP